MASAQLSHVTLPSQIPAIPPANGWPSHGQSQTPVVVVNPLFLALQPVDLIIGKKVMTIRKGQLVVTDVKGSLVFTVKGSLFSIRDQRVLCDPTGYPILCLRQKIITTHRRWQAYRGESSNWRDLLFTIRRSSAIQSWNTLDVFLAGNNREEVPDFRIEGEHMGIGCTITLGRTNNIVAQMHKRLNLKTVMLDKDTYAITVYPNVDYAFIVALIVAFNEIIQDQGNN